MDKQSYSSNSVALLDYYTLFHLFLSLNYFIQLVVIKKAFLQSVHTVTVKSCYPTKKNVTINFTSQVSDYIIEPYHYDNEITGSKAHPTCRQNMFKYSQKQINTLRLTLVVLALCSD